MECFEKGLITKEDTGGIELKFGDAAAMVKAVEMLVKGEGLSDLFGQGVRSAAEKIPGSAAFAMHAKGLELGGYECRGSWGQALQFALASRGGCHHAFGLPARTPSDRESGTQIAGKAELVKTGATNRIILDSSVLCSFPRGMIGSENLLSLINAVTAKGYSQEELDKVGLRIINLERMFNVREGLRREDDKLPERLTDEPLPDGPHKGSTVPLKELIDEGYKAFGWDKTTGIPTTETLQSLDLAELCRI
jgi:aldehyde:ferredoxin oxidoreductase